jgi:type VI secretion system secreted protein Hcp
MKFQRLSIAMIATAAGLSASAGANAAVDIFLQIDGIQGESADAKFKGASEVLAWSWGEVSSANGKKGCIEDMHITKVVDKASPALITNASTGAPASKAVLSMRKAGDSQGTFLIITMNGVRVSSYQISGSSGAGAPFESLSLSFETMSGEYRAQKPDGSLDAGIPWNIGPNGGKCQ